MNQQEIKKLIKQANNSNFSPSQVAFASAAKDYVHTEPEPKIKYGAIKGRYKRHLERKARGVSYGFGQSWSAEQVWFRCEFNWCDPKTEDESNEQLHWVACRKFKGKEYKFFKNYFDRADKKEWLRGETVESKFVLRYITAWLIAYREEKHLNQCFIFPSPNKGNETIREAIYHALWWGEYPNYMMDEDLAIVLKKNVWHEWE